MASRPRQVKITGERGRTLALVEGQWLPVLHERHWNFHNHSYRAPLGQTSDAAEHDAYVSALQNNTLAVMERDAPLSGGNFAGQIYIGVFRYGDLSIADDHLSLTLLERYASPRP